ncbi:MAG: IPT/TIG domain-containing protein, partial [Akkermansiaceae bacterium]|nr:IPT/TIG domain-containing protein [Akkermansiaceae bacterium]
MTDIQPLPTLPDADGNSLGTQRVLVTGSGFDPDPDNMCVVVRAPGGTGGPVPTFPLTVLNVPSPDRMVLEIPPLPGGLPPAPLSLVLGQGNRGPVDLAFPDVIMTEPPNAFDGRSEPVQSQVPLDLRTLPPAPTPPPSTRWFFSSIDQGANALCLFIDGSWGNCPTVDVAGDITVKLASGEVRTVELRSRGNAFPPPPPPPADPLAACAERVKDLIRCIITQRLPQLPPGFVQVDCIQGPVAGVIKIQIRIIDPQTQQPALLCGGGFRLCVTDAKPPPTVTGCILRPRGVIREGSLIKITGNGFPEDGETSLVAQMCTQPCPVPLEVIFSNRSCVVLKVGPVAPGLAPAPIKIFCGRGSTSPWISMFQDVFPQSPGQLTVSPCVPSWPPLVYDPFAGPNPPQLIPSGPSNEPGVEYFGATIDGQGRFCIPLTSDWGPRPLIAFNGFFKIKREGAAAGDPGLVGSLRTARTRLEGQGIGGGPASAQECAERIADIFRCGLDGFWEVTVEFPVGGPPTIYLSVPGYDVCEGKMQLCLYRPLPPVVPTVVTNLTPGPIDQGSLLRIGGTGGFDPDPDNNCAVVGRVALHIVGKDPDGSLIGLVGLRAPGVPLGLVQIEPGREVRRFPIPIVEGGASIEPPEVLVGDGVGLTPVPGALPELPGFPDENVIYYVSEPVGPNGELCMYIDGEWCPGAKVQFEGHVAKQEADGTCTGFDWNIPDVRLDRPDGGPAPDLVECVHLIKDQPACAFEQGSNARQALIWECFPEDIDGIPGIDRVKLVVRCPFADPATGVGFFKPGSSMTLCVRNPEKDPQKIVRIDSPTGVFPICLNDCDIICVEVCNFGCDPKDICAMISDQPAGVNIPMRVVEIIKDAGGPGVDKLVIQVGRIPAGAQPGRLCLELGEGNCGIWQPGVGGLTTPTRDGWVWQSVGNEPVYSSPNTVLKPVPGDAPKPNETCITGLPNAAADAICVDLAGTNWVDCTEVKITGHIRVFNDAGEVVDAIDIKNPITTTVGAGTPEECCDNLIDIWRCELQQMAQITRVIVKCDNLGDTDPNTTQLKICAPPGHTVQGVIDLCLCTPEPPYVLKDPPAGTKIQVCTGDIVCLSFANLPPGHPEDKCIVVLDRTTGETYFRLDVLESVP